MPRPPSLSRRLRTAARWPPGVAGDLKAEQVVRLRAVRTLARPKVRIRVRDDTVFLSRRAKVVKTDVSASNGTIHAIDRVLLPPAR